MYECTNVRMKGKIKIITIIHTFIHSYIHTLDKEMAIVSFWSNGESETGKTLSIAAIATQMALENNFRVLILNTQYNDMTIEDCFWNTSSKGRFEFQEGRKTDIDTGIKGLSKAILSNKTSPEIITNYTKTIFKDRLELLTDSQIPREEYEKQRILLKEMIKMANKYYDIVLVDVEGSLEDSIVQGILEISNIIVGTLSQNLRKINDYVKLRQQDTLFSGPKVMFIIGRYDKKSAYSIKNISRHMGEKEIYGIPYSTLFFESCNEGKTADFFIKFRKAKLTDNNGLLIDSVRTIVGAIIEKIRMLQKING
ncbi:MAG: hypothetical protein FWC53_01110 [Firmicutes bacterium]|nr:hypothetical protein [Bacillota bacterium]